MMAMSASAAVLCPDVIVAVETQFARLTTAAPAGPADCSVAATEAPAKTTIKKKKKKVKGLCEHLSVHVTTFHSSVQQHLTFSVGLRDYQW